ncbi:MAG: protein translocase subunit SecF, partial [Geminicoccales bacterium]
MRRLRLVPDDTRIHFMRYQYVGYALSATLILLTVFLLPIKGLNFGIDFQGGILVEVGVPGEAADLAAMRATLGELGLGEVALQEFGAPTDVLIRVQRQEGGEEAQLAAVDKVRAALTEEFGEEVSYRRVEFVGPKVSSELLWGSTQAVVYSILAILVYIWFRFEWQFGVGAVATLVLDVTKTIGFFVITGLQFNLVSVAAILTIMGYSINDKVVVYDRVRENLRKYKRMELDALLDLSINQTLSRTILTGCTAIAVLLALYIFGGEVIRNFNLAMLLGVLIGTYSSMFIGAP